MHAEGKEKRKGSVRILANLAACSFCRKAIFAAEVLNFCVRDGNRCDHFAIAARSHQVSFPEN